MNYSIYGLADPKTPEQIRYVGQTKGDPLKRIAGHCALTREFVGACDCWLLALQFARRRPLVSILATCNSSERSLRIEGEMVRNYAAEHDLLNSIVWRKRRLKAGLPRLVLGGYTAAFYSAGQRMSRSYIAKSGDDEILAYESDPYKIRRVWMTVEAIEMSYPSLSILRDATGGPVTPQMVRDWIANRRDTATPKKLAISEPAYAVPAVTC